jgi:SAM-dependent methyltransferase
MSRAIQGMRGDMTEDYFHYLREVQYKVPSNLEARAALHQRFSRHREGLHRWIFDHLLQRAEGLILELGAGPGYLWTRNRDRIPPSWSVFLSDISQGMVSAARRELTKVATNIHYAIIDAQSIPFPSDCLDVIIANHMIYHIPEIPKAIGEMQRILRPGGMLFASTNADDHMHEVYDLVHAIAPSIIFGSRDLNVMRGIPFSLDNGREMLGDRFDPVFQFKLDDELIISEARPLIDYILSFPGNAQEIFGTVNGEAELQASIEEVIRDQGSFNVTKSAGMFIAIK